ncbi:Polymeric immunoglobulin receptor [Larimichthys crocea]|nr:Polymeric immunoglobulin receptor [Larimichthys crocea]
MEALSSSRDSEGQRVSAASGVKHLPRHLVSGDSYSIKAVTREDAGGYQCQAEPWESSNSTSGKILSEPVELSVLELPPSALTLTPNTRQLFRGERFTVQCPESRTNSSGWMLKHFPSSRRDRKRVLHPDQCSPLGGAVSEDNPDACAFTAVSANGGLYWCQGPEGRSNSVNITWAPVILKTPAFPVLEGDEVILSCQYLSGTPGKTTFFKNGAEMNTSYSSASSNRVIKMTIENVTQDDEGFYKCASQDGKMESPESWLSVIPDRGNLTTDGTASTSDQLVGDMAKLKVKTFDQRKKEENTDAKINHEIEKLENENNEIYRASSEQQGDLQARL